MKSRLLQSGDIVVEKSGGSPTQSTGRVVFISESLIEAKGQIVCSNFCTVFRVKDGWNPYFVYQYWQYVYNAGVFFNFEGKTSGIKNLQIDNALSAIQIKHYPICHQNSISTVLISIENKISLNRSINDNLAILGHSLREAEVHHVA